MVLGSIDALLDRGQRLDALVSRSDRLTSQTRSFERSSLRLKQHQRWRAVRRGLLIVAGILVVAVIALLSVCGADFGRCRR